MRSFSSFRVFSVSSAFGLLSSFSLFSASGAIIINVTADNSVAMSASEGSISMADPIAGGTASESFSYTISGLTLDASGTADDSVDVGFTISSTGGNVNIIGWQGSVSVGGAWMSADDVLTIAYSAMSVNLNGGTNNGSGEFLGISSYKINGWGAGEEASVNGDNISFDGGDPNTYSFSPTTESVAFAFVADGPDPGAFRFDSFSFAFSVPEPSSSVLGALAGLSLLLRRQRA